MSCIAIYSFLMVFGARSMGFYATTITSSRLNLVTGRHYAIFKPINMQAIPFR